MVQLILNGITLPETSKDKYSCYAERLTKQIDMISGRRTSEVRGYVQKVHYSYDYMGNELTRQVMSIIRSGQPFEAAFLPDDSDELQTGTFLTESYSNPTFAFSRTGTPYWHNIDFVLREVKPHD